MYDDIDESSSDSSEDIRFTYNAYGYRTSKVYQYDPGPDYSGDFTTKISTNYYYDHSGRLIKETSTESFTESSDVNRELIYLYDESGVIGVMYSYDGETAQVYYYRKNLLGDVVAIYDSNGVRKAEYAYDAFGNCSIVYRVSDADIANINPIRYRGYYYDKETKLYFLNARYYNPEWRRFISPDSTEYIDSENPNGLNLYAYCCNDPVNYADPSGNDPERWQWALFGVGVALVAVAAGMAILGTGGVAAFGMGALIGSVAVGGAGAVVGGAIGYATDGADGILGGALAGFGIGAIVGFAVGGTIGYYNSLVQVDINKFTNYVLDPANSKGKHVVFKNLGYDKSNAKALVRIYKRQGLKNFLRKNYLLGKSDIYGQRITIGIKIGDAVLKTGWMLLENGIKLITPFSGFLE